MAKVIDIHAHVGNSASLYVAGSIEAVVSRMEANGITHSVISPIPGFEDPEGAASADRMNEQVAAIRGENRKKFPLALGVAEPRHGAAAACREAEYALGELELGGLMFHNDFAGVPIHAAVMEAILGEVMHYPKARVVQMHTAQHSMLEPPFALGLLAEKFPDILFLCGHPMMSPLQLDNMAAVARRCPNLYLDTCCTWTHNGQIERALEALGGSERFMFGSDNPYYNRTVCLDKLLLEKAPISQADRDNIFYKNFERVFGKVEE